MYVRFTLLRPSRTTRSNDIVLRVSLSICSLHPIGMALLPTSPPVLLPGPETSSAGSPPFVLHAPTRNSSSSGTARGPWSSLRRRTMAGCLRIRSPLRSSTEGMWSSQRTGSYGRLTDLLRLGYTQPLLASWSSGGTYYSGHTVLVCQARLTAPIPPPFRHCAERGNCHPRPRDRWLWRASHSRFIPGQDSGRL